MASKIEAVDDVTFTDCMEQLQEGYVAAVAASAACLMETLRRDLYGFDVMLTRPAAPGVQESTILAQLKNTTTIKPDATKEHFSYTLKKRAYFEHLAAPRTSPKGILLVMVTSPKQSEWTKGDHENLSLSHCCYWVCLEGETAAEGVKSPTIHVPTKQIFTAESLTSILDRADRGEALRD